MEEHSGTAYSWEKILKKLHHQKKIEKKEKKDEEGGQQGINIHQFASDLQNYKKTKLFKYKKLKCKQDSMITAVDIKGTFLACGTNKGQVLVCRLDPDLGIIGDFPALIDEVIEEPEDQFKRESEFSDTIQKVNIGDRKKALEILDIKIVVSKCSQTGQKSQNKENKKTKKSKEDKEIAENKEITEDKETSEATEMLRVVVGTQFHLFIYTSYKNSTKRDHHKFESEKFLIDLRQHPLTNEKDFQLINDLYLEKPIELFHKKKTPAELREDDAKNRRAEADDSDRWTLGFKGFTLNKICFEKDAEGCDDPNRLYTALESYHDRMPSVVKIWDLEVLKVLKMKAELAADSDDSPDKKNENEKEKNDKEKKEREKKEMAAKLKKMQKNIQNQKKFFPILYKEDELGNEVVFNGLAVTAGKNVDDKLLITATSGAESGKIHIWKWDTYARVTKKEMSKEVKEEANILTQFLIQKTVAEKPGLRNTRSGSLFAGVRGGGGGGNPMTGLLGGIGKPPQTAPINNPKQLKLPIFGAVKEEKDSTVLHRDEDFTEQEELETTYTFELTCKTVIENPDNALRSMQISSCDKFLVTTSDRQVSIYERNHQDFFDHRNTMTEHDNLAMKLAISEDTQMIMSSDKNHIVNFYKYKSAKKVFEPNQFISFQEKEGDEVKNGGASEQFKTTMSDSDFIMYIAFSKDCQFAAVVSKDMEYFVLCLKEKSEHKDFWGASGEPGQQISQIQFGKRLIEGKGMLQIMACCGVGKLPELAPARKNGEGEGSSEASTKDDSQNDQDSEERVKNEGKKVIKLWCKIKSGKGKKGSLGEMKELKELYIVPESEEHAKSIKPFSSMKLGCTSKFNNVFASSGNAIYCWDLKPLEDNQTAAIQPKVWRGGPDMHSNDIKAIDLNDRDSTVMVSACKDKILYWVYSRERDTYECKGPLSSPATGGSTKSIDSVRISHDASVIAAGNGTLITVWIKGLGGEDPDSYHPLKNSLKSHFGNVKTLDISEDNRMIVSGAADNFVKIWYYQQDDADVKNTATYVENQSIKDAEDWVKKVLIRKRRGKSVNKTIEKEKEAEEFQLQSYSNEDTFVFAYAGVTDKTLRVYSLRSDYFLPFFEIEDVEWFDVNADMSLLCHSSSEANHELSLSQLNCGLDFHDSSLFFDILIGVFESQHEFMNNKCINSLCNYLSSFETEGKFFMQLKAHSNINILLLAVISDYHETVKKALNLFGYDRYFFEDPDLDPFIIKNELILDEFADYFEENSIRYFNEDLLMNMLKSRSLKLQDWAVERFIEGARKFGTKVPLLYPIDQDEGYLLIEHDSYTINEALRDKIKDKKQKLDEKKVKYLTTSIKVDLALNSTFVTNLLKVLKDSDENVLTSDMKHLIRHLWVSNKWVIWLFAAINWLATFLAYYAIVWEPTSLYIIIPSVFFFTLLILFEIIVASVDPGDYIDDFLNWLDVMIYLGLPTIMGLNYYSHTSATKLIDDHKKRTNFVITLFMGLAAIRSITMFKVVDGIRYLVAMILEVFSDIRFLAVIMISSILFFSMIEIQIMKTRLGEQDGDGNDYEQPTFFSAFDIIYNVAYGDWGGSDAMNWNQYIHFLANTSILNLIMINLMIAITSKTFEDYEESKDLFDIKGTLEILSDYNYFMTRLLRERKEDDTSRNYIHLMTIKDNEDDEGDTFNKLEELEGVISEKFEEAQSFIDKRCKDLENRIDRVDNNMNDNIRKNIREIDAKTKLNKNTLRDMKRVWVVLAEELGMSEKK